MKKRNNKELIDIAAQLKTATSKGRVKQRSIKDKLSSYDTNVLQKEVRHAVSITNLQSRSLRLADSFASNVITLPPRQTVRATVTAELISLLDREQNKDTLKYKILHPGPMDHIPSNVNLKCPKCAKTIEYFTGLCTGCGYTADVPPVMQ